MKFAKYFARRVIQMIPALLAVIIINFMIIHLAPGDPATVLAGDRASDAYLEQLRVEFGLNEPILKQLVIYIGNILRGNLGNSYQYKKPVIDLLLSKMKVTLMLVLLSEILSIIIGTLMGMVAAKHEGKLGDHFISNLSMVIYCIPSFWLGMMFILFFAVKLHWLPSSGMYSFMSKIPRWLDIMKHLILPSAVLTIVHLPLYIKLARSSVVEVAQEDFITTARAIGYSEKVVYRKHALRNALLPTVTQAGMSLSTVFSGALLTETVFSWPGMGRLVYDAISTRDYPVIMGGFLVTATLVIIGSLITDIIYMYLDPRVVHK